MLHVMMYYLGLVRFLNFLISAEVMFLTMTASVVSLYEGCKSIVVLFLGFVLMESSVALSTLIRLNRFVSTNQKSVGVLSL